MQTDSEMSAVEKSSGGDNYQILVVDDEQGIRLSFKLLLEREGYGVSVVESGAVALAWFAERKFDLVITDLSMPGMRGDELITRIRQLSPKQPIVMASGFVDESIVGQASNQVDAFLPKPFSLEALRQAVDQAVHRSATH